MLMDAKPIIEAALFMSGRWMSLEDLARVAGTASMDDVKRMLAELQREYGERGIVLIESNERYRMEVRPEIRDKVYYLAPEPELTPALMKTLAFIAYSQPISQSEVAKIIGNRTYDYIQELKKKGFVEAKKKGRTKLLHTTGHFNKYFAINPEELKRQHEKAPKQQTIKGGVPERNIQSP